MCGESCVLFHLGIVVRGVAFQTRRIISIESTVLRIKSLFPEANSHACVPFLLIPTPVLKAYHGVLLLSHQQSEPCEFQDLYKFL